MRHPGVAFVDRDGTLNLKAPAGEYIEAPDQLELLPGAAEAVRRLNDARVKVVVVTNQRGIALGRMTTEDLERVHARLQEMLLEQSGARIDVFLWCPHDRAGCSCRKPLPGMLLAARDVFPWLDLSRSAMIGDSDADVGAGKAAGTHTIRLGVDVPDFAAAVDALL